MGLDMYAISVPNTCSTTATSTAELPTVRSLLAQWRKHNALHGWMYQLYRQKHIDAVPPEAFNNVLVNLTAADISALEAAVLNRTLPKTEGFFFGNDSSQIDDYREADLQFVKDAREALSKERLIFYDSWW